ncbi:hypothetical protein [Clostridium sp. UBA6640]|uniref:hypothetical protein n=1 Tax=Clostridium sp. UBA6640 TaxID=1946370 RepID=UPI0025C70836|nr:hypothetical protein [Clostridium sp. UBA6640]
MKENLLKKIYEQEDNLGESLPIVSLEDFFEGNDDIGSIGCNILEHPGIEKFYLILKEIRNKVNVQDVLVEIMEYDELDNTWPFSERIYILTKEEKSEISIWTKELQLDDIGEGYMYGEPKAAPKLEEGCLVYSLWWD